MNVVPSVDFMYANFAPLAATADQSTTPCQWLTSRPGRPVGAAAAVMARAPVRALCARSEAGMDDPM